MKLHHLLFIGLWTLDSGLGTLAAQTNAPGKLDYALFNIVTERNIFNSHRSAKYKPATEPGPQAKIDSFALVGTMSYNKGPFAFFEGTSSDYRKALKLEDAIAGFRVAEIAPAFVKLASPSNELELQVGMELRRENKGPWRLSATSELPLAGATSATGVGQNRGSSSSPDGGPPRVDSESGAAGTNSGTAAISGGSTDILEILRRRREQENN